MAIPRGEDHSFQLQCSIPFAAPSATIDVDQSCNRFGEEVDTSDSPKGVQNSIKNNLCSSGPITTLQQDDFVNLQDLAKQRHIPFGASFVNGERVEHLPDDRSAVTSMTTINGQGIGEGSLVQFVAHRNS